MIFPYYKRYYKRSKETYSQSLGAMPKEQEGKIVNHPVSHEHIHYLSSNQSLNTFLTQNRPWTLSNSPKSPKSNNTVLFFRYTIL